MIQSQPLQPARSYANVISFPVTPATPSTALNTVLPCKASTNLSKVTTQRGNQPIVYPLTPQTPAVAPPLLAGTFREVVNTAKVFPSAVRKEYALLNPKSCREFYQGGKYSIGTDKLGKYQMAALNKLNEQKPVCGQANRIRPPLDLNLATQKTNYIGLGKVASVLRWISSVGLIAAKDQLPTLRDTPATYANGSYISGKENDKNTRALYLDNNKRYTFSRTPQPVTDSLGNQVYTKEAKNDRYTPEIQSTIVAGRLILGSNANEDAYLIKVITHLLDASSPQYIAIVQHLEEKSRDFSEESRYKARQQLRHLRNLHSFIKDPTLLINEAVNGCVNNPQESKITKHFLLDIHTALTTGHIEMAKIPVDPKNHTIEGMVHAEQRVIEYVQRHQESLHQDTINNIDGIDPHSIKLPLIISGTKPPCHPCATTEYQRHLLAKEPNKESPYFFMVRFEDPIIVTHPATHNQAILASVGMTYPGMIATPHPRVVNKLQDTLESVQAHVLNPPSTPQSKRKGATEPVTPKTNCFNKLKNDSPQKNTSGPTVFAARKLIFSK